ncbi:glycosyltransferase [Prevotella fusca]
MYNPRPADLNHICQLAEHYRGIVVDNSATPSFATGQIGQMDYIFNHGNLGIAEAQNRGLNQVLEDNRITHVVFLDQDSRVTTDYPNLITTQYEAIRVRQPQLAMLGPTVVREDCSEEYRSAIHRDIMSEDGFIIRRDVISSGSCVATEVLRKVGLNDSQLFIDFVDFEWCWRAEAKGYICGITSKVQIRHKVGVDELRIGKHTVIISSPIRYYYTYRNYQWLLRRAYVPRQWKIAQGIKQLLRLIYFPFLVKGGCERWKFMVKGLLAGLKKQD